MRSAPVLTNASLFLGTGHVFLVPIVDFCKRAAVPAWDIVACCDISVEYPRFAFDITASGTVVMRTAFVDVNVESAAVAFFAVYLARERIFPNLNVVRKPGFGVFKIF